MYILAGVLASQACSIAPGIEEAGVKNAITALIEIIIDAAKRLTWKPFKYIEATIFNMIKQTAILLATLVKTKVKTHKAIKKPICPLPANKGVINLASHFVFLILVIMADFPCDVKNTIGNAAKQCQQQKHFR